MTPPNPFDQASRHLLRRGGLVLLAWLLRIAQADLRLVRWLDTRLTIPGQAERYCDTIAHVTRLDRGGEPWACPVEFQVEPDENICFSAECAEKPFVKTENRADFKCSRFSGRLLDEAEKGHVDKIADEQKEQQEEQP